MKSDPETARVHVTMLVWLEPGGAPALAAFRERAAPLFDRYDLRVERVLTGTGKGQLVGDNRHDVPDLIQVLTFPSIEGFRAYTSDPEYVRLARLRDEKIRRMVVLIGRPLDVSDLSPRSDSPIGERLYGVALVRFEADGAARLAEFNRRAAALFLRHGMHVESMADCATTVAPVGDPIEAPPERVIVFFLDEPSRLKAYATDPEYRELAPIRDRGLRAYDFFLGKVPS